MDGFHLFKEQMDLPYQEYHPDHRLDIEDKAMSEEVPEEEGENSFLEELEDLEDQEEEELEGVELEKEQEKIWSIIYSKKPNLIVDKDEYDRILIDLLQSYADFK